MPRADSILHALDRYLADSIRNRQRLRELIEDDQTERIRRMAAKDAARFHEKAIALGLPPGPIRRVPLKPRGPRSK